MASTCLGRCLQAQWSSRTTSPTSCRHCGRRKLGRLSERKNTQKINQGDRGRIELEIADRIGPDGFDVLRALPASAVEFSDHITYFLPALRSEKARKAIGKKKHTKN